MDDLVGTYYVMLLETAFDGPVGNSHVVFFHLYQSQIPTPYDMFRDGIQQAE